MKWTTKTDIAQWFSNGVVRKDTTHMIVVSKTIDYSTHPVYVETGQDVQKCLDIIKKRETMKVMEVYDLSLPRDEQLGASLAWNF